jgi:hypothetical protein
MGEDCPLAEYLNEGASCQRKPHIFAERTTTSRECEKDVTLLILGRPSFKSAALAVSVNSVGKAT